MYRMLFKDYIYMRGLDYYYQGLVDQLVIDGRGISAIVHGSEDYVVEIDLIDGEVSELFCSCPYAASGENCKHMAAVLYYLDKEQAQPKESLDLSQLLADSSAEEMRNFLIKLFETNPDFIDRFILSSKGQLIDGNIKRYYARINDIFSRYMSYDDFFDYRGSWDLAVNLVDYMNDEIINLIENGYLIEALELILYVLDNYDLQAMDDSAGGSVILRDAAYEQLSAIILFSHGEVEEEIFKVLIKVLVETDSEYWHDLTEDFLFNNFKEDKYYLEKEVYLKDMITLHSDNLGYLNYYLKILHLRMLKLYEDMGRSLGEIISYCESNIDHYTVRDYYIELSIGKEDLDKAIELALEGKNLYQELPGLRSNYSKVLKKLYKTQGNRDLYERELKELLVKDRMGEEIYLELKGLYSQEEWNDKRKEILGSLKDHYRLGRFYEIEGLYDSLLDWVLAYSGLSRLRDHEGILRDIFPEALLDRYEDHVIGRASHTSNRKVYRELVGILRHMQDYSGGKKRVAKIRGDLREKYKNRPAMMDELDKL